MFDVFHMIERETDTQHRPTLIDKAAAVHHDGLNFVVYIVSHSN